MTVASAVAMLVSCPLLSSSHHYYHQHALDSSNSTGSAFPAAGAACESFCGSSCSASPRRNESSTRYASSLGSLNCLRVAVDRVDRVAYVSSSPLAGRKQLVAGRLDGDGGGRGFASSSSMALSSSSRNLGSTDGVGFAMKAASGRKSQSSVTARREQLEQLQEELARAHTQVHLSEARVEESLRKLAEIEAAIIEKLQYIVPGDETEVGTPTQLNTVTTSITTADEGSKAVISESSTLLTDRNSILKKLNVSGPIAPYPNKLKNFWYPVAFCSDISVDTLIPFESFEEPWVLFRAKDGRAGCVRDECAHRACPLSLGKVVEGQIQCPYHGWEYTTGGKCNKMPSTRSVKASIRSLPCIEQDGMVWIWPGDEIPATVRPSLNPPSNFTIHAEIVLELPVEHGLLMENLLDLAHAPFTHTSTFAKGWPVPNFVRFRTPAAALSGYWDPYPIDMQFQAPCMVLSTIGLVKPGQLDGSSTKACKNHLHQLHVCMPSTRGKTRLLYRMALDFAQWAKHVPFISKVWMYLANQVLSEDLRLVEGQMDRMKRGANVWETPVSYDKLGVRYRRWRNAVETGSTRIPFDLEPSEES